MEYYIYIINDFFSFVKGDFLQPLPQKKGNISL